MNVRIITKFSSTIIQCKRTLCDCHVIFVFFSKVTLLHAQKKFSKFKNSKRLCEIQVSFALHNRYMFAFNYVSSLANFCAKSCALMLCKRNLNILLHTNRTRESKKLSPSSISKLQSLATLQIAKFNTTELVNLKTFFDS